MNLTIGAATDPGRRPNNEDFYAVVDVAERKLPVDAIIVVADGMGGRNFGERASETASEVVQDILAENLLIDPPIPLNDAIISALRHANDRVYALSQEDPESEGMGTTCVVAVVANGRLYLGHAGDSRAYVIHHGRIEQLTDDHSFVAEQVRAGVISEEGARRSKFRNVITRAVGIEPVIEPDVAEYPAEEIDAILLCTDGLSGMVRDQEIERVMLTATDSQSCADRLVRMAKHNGGSDNITAVVVKLGEGPIVEPLSGSAPANVGVEDNDADYAVAPSRIPLTSVALLILSLIAVSIYMALLLGQAGYKLRATPPFIVKPSPPSASAQARTQDLSKLRYASAIKFYPYPVRPEPVLLGTDNSVIIAPANSTVAVRLASNQDVITQFAAPKGAEDPEPSRSWHYAADAQGNIYAASSVDRCIYKYLPSGQLLGKITSGLQHPEGIAVDDGGNIYVVDGSTLKYLQAQPE